MYSNTPDVVHRGETDIKNIVTLESGGENIYASVQEGDILKDLQTFKKRAKKFLKVGHLPTEVFN